MCRANRRPHGCGPGCSARAAPRRPAHRNAVPGCVLHPSLSYITFDAPHGTAPLTYTPYRVYTAIHDRHRRRHRPARSDTYCRRYDVLILCGADREKAQPDRRRRGERQLRHRAGDRGIPRHRHSGRADGRGRGNRLHRVGARTRCAGARGVRRVRIVAATPGGVGGAECAGGAAFHDSGVAVPLLAVAGPRARHSSRHLGRLAVPPRRTRQPAPPRRDDGHPHLGRGGCGLSVVGLGAGLHPRGHAGHEDGAAPAGQQRWRTPPISRSRRRGNHLHPRRPLFRGARQAAVRRSASRPARHGRQGRRRAAAWIDRNPHSDQDNSPSTTSSWRGPARRSPPTVSWFRAHRRWTRRC